MGLRLLLLSLLLAGCSTTKFVTAEVPKAPVIERPALEVQSLKEGDTADVVIRAYRITIQQLIGYSKQLEELLKAYQ